METSNPLEGEIISGIERSFLQLGRSKNPEKDLKELDGSIGLLKEVIDSRGGDTGIIDVYQKRLSEKNIQVASRASSSEPHLGIIEGSINQRVNKYGYNETCSGAAVTFLDATLNGGTDGINGKFIDQILGTGADVYHQGLEMKKAQESVLGVSVEEQASQQLHAYNLIDLVPNGLKQVVSPKSVQVSNPRELTDVIERTVERSLIPNALSNGQSGMTISFNGKTYALVVSVKKEGPEYTFFDSHGTSPSKPALAIQTSRLSDIQSYLVANVQFVDNTVDPELAKALSKEELAMISAAQDGQNKVGFCVMTAQKKGEKEVEEKKSSDSQSAPPSNSNTSNQNCIVM